MSLEAFYYVSQIIASFAVLASLIYLALQTRQTAQNQRAMIVHSTISRAIDMAKWQVEKDNLEFRMRTRDPGHQLTETDVIRLYVTLRVLVLSYQDTLLQSRLGFMDAGSLETTRRAMRLGFSEPAMRAVWDMQKLTVTPELATAIERDLISGIPLATAGMMTARFQATLAKVLADNAPSHEIPEKTS